MGPTARLLRWLPLAAIVALLGAAMLAAAFGNPSLDLVQEQPPPLATASAGGSRTELVTPPPVTSATPTTSAELTPLPAWVGWVVTSFCTIAVLLIVGALLWVMLRDRFLGRTVAVSTPLDEAAVREETRLRVQAAVDEGLAGLDEDGTDPRQVIIACWVRLERAGGAVGTPRTAVDTSTDFVARLLAAHRVSGAVLEAFAAVYREARYATHPVDEAARDQARAALRLLRDELANPVAVGAGGAP